MRWAFVVVLTLCGEDSCNLVIRLTQQYNMCLGLGVMILHTDSQIKMETLEVHWQSTHLITKKESTDNVAFQIA